MISIIIPFYNEEKSIKELCNQITEVMEKQQSKYEIIFVNDGSTDKSGQIVAEITNNNNRVTSFTHKTRKGKGEALATGIQNSKGEILMFMDADLQDDPSDIPHFIKTVNSGFDFVNGVRVHRKDNFLIRSYSKMAKLFLTLFLKSPFSDINCGFKAMKREVFDDIILYGNNFRFLPLAASYKGFKVTEIEVHNNARKFGVSKFGKSKLFTGFLDTLTAYFLYCFSEKPLHFFGMYGGLLLVGGAIILTILSIERIFFSILLYRRPLLFAGLLLVIVGVQIIATGFIGELIVYFDKKKRRHEDRG